mgnify:CR=1 FL=1
MAAQTTRAFAPGERVAVLLPLPVDGAYDYTVPEGTALAPGAIVRAPLGARHETGVVWGPGEGDVPAGRLRPVAAVLDVPPLPAPLGRLVDWVAGYTMAPRGSVLRMALAAVPGPRRRRTLYAPADAPPPGLRWTDARRRVWAAATAHPRPAADLARAAGAGNNVVRGLADAGALVPVTAEADADAPEPDPHRPRPALSADQAAVGADLAARVREHAFSVTLLDGVTGSGKTEVYFRAVAAALAEGRQALVLLPEIALTGQWLERFEARFGARPALWHSDLSPGRRRETWRRVAEGRASVVVGARSALFLPFRDLALIVVDEEHEPAFKQEDGVLYNARDMAVVRARLGGLPAVLVSATPSLESMANAGAGRYRHRHLPARHGGAVLPAIETVDLRRRPPERLPADDDGARAPGWLAPPLVEALGATLAAGRQAMLFLNRRGYAPLTLCRACGHRLGCPHCTAWLVEHRRTGALVCHHCGEGMARPPACPQCGATDSLVPCGPGVERLVEEVARRFPAARTALMTSDTLTGPQAVADLVGRMEAGEVDFLVGTQVVAKGHHFPALTLVGVVDADLGLAGGDLRAAERTYQLLSQVAGRAGRGDDPGRVLLQTHEPDQPVMRALAEGDRDGFLAAEMEARRAAGMPPFGRLAAVIVTAAQPDAADRVADALGRRAPEGDGLAVLGPAPAPLAVLRGRHRRRLLVKARRDAPLQARLRTWLDSVHIPRGVRVHVDVDPYSFM